MKKKDKEKKGVAKESVAPPMEKAVQVLQSQIAHQKRPNVLETHIKLLNPIHETLIKCKDNHAEAVRKLQELEERRKYLENIVVLRDGAPKDKEKTLKDVMYILAIERAKWEHNVHGGREQAQMEDLLSKLSLRLCPGAAEKPFSFESLRLYLTVSTAFGRGHWMTIGFLNDWLHYFSSSINNPSDWIDTLIDRHLIKVKPHGHGIAWIEAAFCEDADYQLEPEQRLEDSLRQMAKLRDSILGKIKMQSMHFDKSFDIIEDMDDSLIVKKAPALPHCPWTAEEEDKCRAFVRKKLLHLPEEVSQSLMILWCHCLSSVPPVGL
jgi:hypothetical protein